MMDIQTILNNAFAAQRAEKMKASPQLTLGELILHLEKFLPEKANDIVCFDRGKHPTGLSSWRGSYCELALEDDGNGDAPTLKDFIEMLKGAIGKTYEGYKGGDYIMGKTTPMWVSNYGEADDTGVLDVVFADSKIVLITGACEL